MTQPSTRSLQALRKPGETTSLVLRPYRSATYHFIIPLFDSILSYDRERMVWGTDGVCVEPQSEGQPQPEASVISVNSFRCNLGLAFRFVTRRFSESNAGLPHLGPPNLKHHLL